MAPLIVSGDKLVTSGLKPRKKIATDLSVSKFLKTVFSRVVSVYTRRTEMMTTLKIDSLKTMVIL